MRRYHCVYQTILVAIAHQYVAVKKGIMAANEMKILECTLLSDRKRIKVILILGRMTEQINPRAPIVGSAKTTVTCVCVSQE